MYLSYDSADDRRVVGEKEWDRGAELVIFDELHKMRKWNAWLRGVYDAEGVPPAILVTGCARLEVSRRGVDSLAGRHFLHRSQPFTVREVRKQMAPAEALARILRFGGFPEPFLGSDPDEARRWTRGHLDIILREDLLDLERVRGVRSVEILVDLLRERVGSTVSLSSLARELPTSVHGRARARARERRRRARMGPSLLARTRRVTRAIVRAAGDRAPRSSPGANFHRRGPVMRPRRVFRPIFRGMPRLRLERGGSVRPARGIHSRRSTVVRGASLFLIGIGIAIAACSGAAGSNTNTGGASSGGSGAIGVGGSGAIGTGASSGSGGLAGGCASDTYDGELVPLDMYVMLDRSGSMSDAGKWSAVTSAINQFVQLPGIDGLGMGLGVFPKVPNPPPPPTCTTNADCGPGGLCVPIVMVCEVPDSCEPTDYAQPVVGIAPLPGVGSAITTAIGGVSPGGGTPSTPALQGAMMYSMAWAKAHTDHITVVVLATDGEPVGCSPNDVSTVSAVAAQGLAASPLVRTFVVGVGSELTALNAVAQAGGTDQAIIVSAGNAAQEFLAALNKIRGAVGCIYNIPVATGGETDPTKVNVGFTPQGGAQEIFPKVDSAAQCQGQKAWYYDDNANPSQIILCPAACDLVTNQKGKVDVVLGCATIVR